MNSYNYLYTFNVSYNRKRVDAGDRSAGLLHARYVKNTQNGGPTAWNEEKKDMYSNNILLYILKRKIPQKHHRMCPPAIHQEATVMQKKITFFERRFSFAFYLFSHQFFLY